MSDFTKALKHAAKKAAVQHGHRLTPWGFIAQADAKGAYCDQCWAMVWVLFDPPRIGGQATTVDCLHA